MLSQDKLETPVPFRTLMQLGPRFALEWVTIEWLNVDAVRTLCQNKFDLSAEKWSLLRLERMQRFLSGNWIHI